MAFCNICQIDVGSSKFCTTCGRPVEASESKQVIDQPSTQRASYSRASFVHWAPLALATLGVIISPQLFGALAMNFTPSMWLIPTLISIFPLLIMWLPGLIIRLSPKSTPFEIRHANASLNYQISLFIYISLFMLFVFAPIIGSFETGMPLGSAGPWVVLLFGLLFLGAFGIAALVFSIRAAAAAGSGEEYRYPIAIRFLK